MNIRLDSRYDHAWQWDLNHRMILEGVAPGVEVHYANSLSENALIVKAYAAGELVVADVPNILLQEALDISVYVYTGQTKHTAFIGVTARAKPDDYIYTPTELQSWEQLEERVTALEQGGGSGGLTITDDGLGHVAILPGGPSSIQDDGAGHIKFL